MHRRVRIEPRRLLRGARGVLRAAIGGSYFAWRDLVGARYVGHQGRRLRSCHAHPLGVRRENDGRGTRADEAVHAEGASRTHGLSLSGAARRPRCADGDRGAQHLLLCQGAWRLPEDEGARPRGNRRRALPARQSNHRPGSAGRLARRSLWNRSACFVENIHQSLDMRREMNLGVDHPRAAVVAIDLHRGHLDMAVATMPTTPEVATRIIAANQRLFDWCRSVDIPIVHQVTSYRDADEIRANPFWRTRAEDPTATRKNVMRHNIIGGPGCTVMPQLLDPRDFVVNTKKRYDCFLGTDLDFLLRSHGINTLLITGVNTNSCVLATTTAANVRDYAVIVVEDCVDSMDGPELHAAGLACVKTAFGFVLNTDAIMALDGLAPRRNSAA